LSYGRLLLSRLHPSGDLSVLLGYFGEATFLEFVRHTLGFHLGSASGLTGASTKSGTHARTQHRCHRGILRVEYVSLGS
jgi:hypothetical protein